MSLMKTRLPWWKRSVFHAHEISDTEPKFEDFEEMSDMKQSRVCHGGSHAVLVETMLPLTVPQSAVRPERSPQRSHRSESTDDRETSTEIAKKQHNERRPTAARWKSR